MLYTILYYAKVSLLQWMERLDVSSFSVCAASSSVSIGSRMAEIKERVHVVVPPTVLPSVSVIEHGVAYRTAEVWCWLASKHAP